MLARRTIGALPAMSAVSLVLIATFVLPLNTQANCCMIYDPKRRIEIVTYGFKALG
jgi:hypothetical protein